MMQFARVWATQTRKLVRLLGDVTGLSIRAGPTARNGYLRRSIHRLTGCAVGAQGAVWRFWRRALETAELRATAEAALARVGLSDEAATRCANLSHGARRQLEVAMALTLRPRAFIMDEPMAGMGAAGSKRLTGLLDGLRQEAPILLVEHDMDAVFALADRISVLVYGKIIATGSAQEIRSSRAVREAYLGDAD